MEAKQSIEDGTSVMDGMGNVSQAKDLNNQLLRSVYDNDLNGVKTLLNLGADVNMLGYAKEKDYTQYTPLILAAEKGYQQMFEELLKTPGIDANKGNSYGSTALHMALNQRHAEMIELLLVKKEINVNAQDSRGVTPLMLAASMGLEEVVEVLVVKPGILINAKDKFGETALHRSIRNGQRDVMKMLLKVRGILVNEKKNDAGHTPLHLMTDTDFNQIATAYYVDALEALLRHPDIDVNVKDNFQQTPLVTAAYHGNARVVAILLKAGANTNEKTDRGFTAAQWAARNGHRNIVQMICEHVKQLKHVKKGGVNRSNVSGQVDALTQRLTHAGISNEGHVSSSEASNLNDQFLSAAKNGDLGKIKELLRHPLVNINTADQYSKNTPLHLASEKGHLEVVQALLAQASIEVNAKNKDNTRFPYPVHFGDDPHRHKLDTGKTAFFLAVVGNHVEVVRALLNDSRTDINTKDKYGTSALHMAITGKVVRIVEILLSHPKIDVNEKDVANDHFTALHSAVEQGNTEIARILLNHPNINVNLKDAYYEATPLHLAVIKNNLEIVQAILNHPRVDVLAKDTLHRTPLHFAAEEGHLDILNCLLSVYANVNAKDACGRTPTDLARTNKHVSCINALQNARR